MPYDEEDEEFIYGFNNHEDIDAWTEEAIEECLDLPFTPPAHVPVPTVTQIHWEV